MKIRPRTVLVGAVTAALLAVLVAGVWARSVFSGDLVRRAVASQLAARLGQPVDIGAIELSFFPRFTLRLDDVVIGEAAAIRVDRLRLGVDLRALVSRRIENATIIAQRAHLTLPLPAFTFQPSGADPVPGSAPIRLGQIREVVFEELSVASGGRTLGGDLRLVPQERGVIVQEARLEIGETTFDVTGRLDALSPPSGTLSIDADTLNLLDLLAFLSDFEAGAERSSPAGQDPQPAQADAAPMNIAVSIEADRALLGTLPLEPFHGSALIGSGTVSIEPVTFGVLGGQYDGSIVLPLSAPADVQIQASVAGVDAGVALAFVGRPGVLTGTLNATLALSGRLGDGRLTDTLNGQAVVEVIDGTVTGLGLVPAIVLATSMRDDARAEARTAARNADEAFSRLHASFAIRGTRARTTDLTFESPDVRMSASGTVQLDGSAIDLAGRVQLSDALSARAGRDLVRYTAEGGRVTLPVTVRGSPGDLQVGIDIAETLRRAITNRAVEGARDAIRKGIEDLRGE